MSFDDTWDRPHVPGTEPDWQESDCYWFYDSVTGAGGYQRIGQKPNRMTGQLTLFVFAGNGQRFTINDIYTNQRPIGPSDSWGDGRKVQNHSAKALGDGKVQFTWTESDTSADLEFYESFYPPRGWSKTGHETEFMKTMNQGGHLECSGRLRGSLRIGSQTYNIDALAHRDRSWGFRDMGLVSWHRFRMFSGTVGPELSFASFVADRDVDGEMVRTVAGFVVRSGVEEDVADLKVRLTLDADGITPLASDTLITLKSGEVIPVLTKTLDGFFTSVPAAGCYQGDAVSEVYWNGKRGFCELVHTTNPGRGTYIPVKSDVSLLAYDIGLSPRQNFNILQPQA